MYQYIDLTKCSQFELSPFLCLNKKSFLTHKEHKVNHQNDSAIKLKLRISEVTERHQADEVMQTLVSH